MFTSNIKHHFIQTENPGKKVGIFKYYHSNLNLEKKKKANKPLQISPSPITQANNYFSHVDF